MASGELYEVERIVDKRKNKKGKWEYLIRWKGYGSKEDTWEPEHHLLHCEEFIDQFNGLRLQERRTKPAKSSGATSRNLSHAQDKSRGENRKKKRTSGTGAGAGLAAPQKPRKVTGSKPSADRTTKPMTFKSVSSGLQFVPPIRGSSNGLQNGEMDTLHYRTTARTQSVPSSRAERMMGDTELSGATPLNELGSLLPNGDAHLHSSAKRKLAEDKGYVFDKRLRYNVRQNETNYRFRDIVVRKEEGFTHVLLSSQTSDNNALTPEIMKEMCRALGNAAVDDSKLLLLSAVGSIFCSGLDPSYLIGRLSTDRRKESSRIADAVRDFVKAFIHFKKPIVVAVNGPALGLGASILPLCDIVWASERAWFQTPCAALRLTPSGCSSYTFPQILGVALANEMLFCGRKLTAQEACSRGLVSQVFWPTTFNQEVMLRVKEMAACSAVVLEESKCMVRSILKSVLEDVNEKECQMLKQLWCSTKGLEALFNYLQNKGVIFIPKENRLSLKDVTKLEMIYQIDNPNQGTWHACQLIQAEDDALCVNFSQFREQFIAHLEDTVKHVSVRTKKLVDGAIWIRVAWGDNFRKPNHLKPTYAVHYLQTPYVFVLNLTSKHKPFLYQALVLSTKYVSIKDAHLSCRSLTAMRNLLMRQYQQVFPTNQERTLSAQPSCPNIEKEHAVYSERRHQIACEAFGDGNLPKLETAVYKLETKYRGSSNNTLNDKDELFRGVIKFSSSNLLESLHHCVSTGMAEGPVTPLLSSITQKGRNYFVITDKVQGAACQTPAPNA